MILELLDTDFNSNPINIAIKAGAINASANISVTCDNIIEGTEIFDISLKLISDNHQVMMGRNRSLGHITDSTGKLVM